MSKVIKEKAAPKRGSFVYWLLLILTRGFVPGFILIFIPSLVIHGTGSIALTLIPFSGAFLTGMLILKKHNQIMQMNVADYQKRFKTRVYTGNSSRNYYPSHNTSHRQYVYESSSHHVNHHTSIHTIPQFYASNTDELSRQYATNDPSQSYYNPQFGSCMNASDAMMTGEYFIPGTAGHVFNPDQSTYD